MGNNEKVSKNIQVEYFDFTIQLIHFQFIFKSYFRLSILSHAKIKYVLKILINLVILIAVLVTIFKDCQIKHKKSTLEKIENLNIKLYNLS